MPILKTLLKLLQWVFNFLMVVILLALIALAASQCTAPP